MLETLVSRWRDEGKLASTHTNLPFAERMARVLTEMGAEAYDPFDISLPLSGVSADSPIHMGPAIFRLLTSPRLIDAVEQFVGPEVLSNPIQHVRIKPPERLLPPQLRNNNYIAKTAWHQDQGVGLPEVDETDMLTVWIPVTDATIENGCLCVVPRSHLGGLAVHCPRIGIPEALRGPDYTPLPMRRGSVLFMHRRTMHNSLHNESDGVRWSFDLRYQPVGQPTGRPVFPAFVVRSRLHPETEVRDPDTWAKLWWAARDKLACHPQAAKVKRWTGKEPVCA